MNLEKQRGAQNKIKKLIVDNKETTDHTHILECIKEFYEILFKKRKQKTTTEIKSFFSHINIAKLSEDKKNIFEEDLTEQDLYDSLKTIQNDKSPGNDGLTKDFYETFWNELEEILIDSVSEINEKGHLSRKKDKDKRFI